MSSFDATHGVDTSQIVVPVGATLAVLVSQNPGQNSTILKYFAGGTLEIFGVTYGLTLGASALASLSGTGYIMGASEILSFNGPVRLYLSSTGATTTVMCLRGKTQGT